MSLENYLKENTAALNRLAEAIETASQPSAPAADVTPLKKQAKETEKATSTPEPEEKITRDELQTTMVKVAKKHGKDAVHSVIGKYNAKTIKDISVEDYGSVVAELMPYLEQEAA